MPRKLKIPKCHHLAFSPCGQRLVTASRDVFLCESSTGKKIWSVRPLKNPSELAFDMSGQLLAVKDTLGEIVILDAGSGALSCKLSIPNPCEGSNICFTGDGEFLINGTWDGRIEKFRISDGKLVDSVCFEDQMVTQIFPARTNQEFAVLHGRHGKNSLSKFPANSWGVNVDTTELPDHTEVFAILPDQTLLLASRRNIQLHNGNTQTIIYESDDSILRFCVNNSSDLAAIVHEDSITLVNLSSRTVNTIFKLPFACAIDFSPASDELAVGSAKSGVVIFGTSELRNAA